MAKKGQKFKMWSAEEKFNIIEPIIKFEKSSKLVTKETGINVEFIKNKIIYCKNIFKQ